MQASPTGRHDVAILESGNRHKKNDFRNGQPQSPSSSSSSAVIVPDWMLDNYDRNASREQDVESEIRRLQALKTFALLDRPPEECFRRFTAIAARTFRTAFAQLSLVDLGRTFTVAQTGTFQRPTSREVPRKKSFCAHVILHRQPVMVVNDAAFDPRFLYNEPMVRDQEVRFFAGASLVTPDGHRVGCLSVMDTKPRPEGLSDEDRQALTQLAACVMDLMLEKRAAARVDSNGGPGQREALDFSYDIQRAAVQLKESIVQLKDDSDFQTVASDSHRSLLQAAFSRADHLLSTMTSARRRVRQKQNHAPHTMEAWFEENRPCDYGCLAPAKEPPMTANSQRHGNDGENTAELNSGSPATQATTVRQEQSSQKPSSPNGSVGEYGKMSVRKMLENIISAMEVFPKKVNLAFVVDPEVPSEILCNDLKVFRSSIALLTSACERTERGFIRFRVYKKVATASGSAESTANICSGLDTAPNPDMLVFECEDTGQDVALEQYHELFQKPGKEELESDVQQQAVEEECITVDPATGTMHKRAFCQPNETPISGGFAVYPVAYYVISMGGEYGYLPRIVRQSSTNESLPESGSVFWFSIPLRDAVSSLDVAVGTALGLDDAQERTVVGDKTGDLRLSTSTTRSFN